MENHHANKNLTDINFVVEFPVLLGFNTQVKQWLSIILTFTTERQSILRQYFKQALDLLVSLKLFAYFNPWPWSAKTIGTYSAQ